MNAMVKPISMYCHGCGDIKFYNMPCACTGVAQLQWADSAKTFRPVDVKFPGTATYVDGPRIGQAADPDPWVKVGTTTIDGTYAQVNAMFGVDAVGKTTSLGPTLVGGRMLQPTGWHLNKDLQGCALVFCDIVRRQSEIEAEGAAKQAEFDREVATMEARDYPHGLPRPPCPECGPHGNRGEVLLASSWAKCTTCAGGKPGDLWGEVKAESFPGVKSYTLAIGDLVFDEEVEAKLRKVEIACGMRGPDGRTFIDVRQEALDNLRRVLLAPPDDISSEDFRRMVLGGGTVP